MKISSSSLKKIRGVWMVAIAAFTLASCGSSRQTASNDGIYGDGGQKATASRNDNPSNGYKEYFNSLREDEVFTNVDQYTSVEDSVAAQSYTTTTGNAGWGSETDQVVVNVYGNNWGWGNPYWGAGWGWGGGWGWNSWYGGGWGWGYGGWGWNSWYGPGWGWGGWGYPYYGYGGYYNPYQYSYNQGIRGGRGNYYGEGSRNSLSRYSTPSRTRQASYANTAGRNSVYSNAGRGGRTGRTYTTTNTRQYTPGRQATPGRQFTSGRNGNTTTTQGRGFSPVYSNSGRNNSYTPATSSGRGSSSPSYSTPSRSSGGSFGGGGGGRSGGGGGGGGRSGGGGGGRR